MGTEVFALVTILRATGTELFRRRTVAPFWGGEKHLPWIVASVSQAYALMRCAPMDR